MWDTLSLSLAELPSAWTYMALATIAFLDTQIGIGFFVFGEVAFLAAGAIGAATGQWDLIALVLLSAWLGDMASFILGQRLGPRALLRVMRRQKHRRALRRARHMLSTHGAKFVVISRLLGPVAWITPFLAGSLGLSRLRFGAAAALGVTLGAGQFLLLGALGATYSQVFGAVWAWIALWILPHWVPVMLLMAFALLCWRIWRSDRSHGRRLCLAGLAAGALFLSSNMVYFFASNAHAKPEPQPIATHQSLCELGQQPLLARPGETPLHLPQPVNIAMIGERSPEALMEQLGWQRNMTFSRDSIGILTYIELLLAGTPPVSELYLNGQPAQSAFQMPGTLSERLHIRWWPAGQVDGQPLYLGAISRDEEIAIKYYRHIPALLHDIDPDVDAARATLAQQIAALPVAPDLHLEPLQPAGEFRDYKTDGKLLIVAEASADVDLAQLTCAGAPMPTAGLS